MRFRVLSLWVLGFFILAHAQPVEWRSMGVCSGISPDLAIDPNNGQLHVVALYQGVIYTKLDPDGNRLLQETIPNTGAEIGLADPVFMGPAIAVDQAGNPHVCYRTRGSAMYYNHIFYTTRTATGWSRPLLIKSEVSRGYAVRMVVDKDNVVHVVHGEAAVGDLSNGTFHYYQIQGNAIRKVQASVGRYHANDRIAIEVDPSGNIHVLVATQFPPGKGPIAYYTSKGGLSDLVYVGDLHALAAEARNGAPDLFADQNGTLHIAYGTSRDTELGGKGSVRYLQYRNKNIVRDKPVTPASGTAALQIWKEGNGWGLGGVAATSGGELIVIGYITKDNGPLYTTYSKDGGVSWSTPEYRDGAWGITDGRALHVLQGYQNNIYLVYQSPIQTIRMRFIRNYGEALPVAHAGGPYEGWEGRPILFNASASIDTGLNAGIVRYEWDWGNDGVFDVYTGLPTIEHTYEDDLLGRVRLRVTDRSGNKAEATAMVHVRNVSPTVNAGPDLAIDENGSVTLTAVVTDPGVKDTYTLYWQLNQTIFVGPSFSTLFPDDGLFALRVWAQDKDGGIGRDTVMIRVRNLPPTADAGGPYRGSRNFPVEIEGHGEDPSPLDILQFAWDLDGDGRFETEGRRITHTWSTAGVYSIVLRVMDDDGGVAYDTTTVTITADAPTVLPIPEQVCREGESFSPLLLDRYVIHPWQKPDQMTWTLSDTGVFLAFIENRCLFVTPPHPDWFGEDTLTLTVRDLAGFMDEGRVVYRVLNVNDPPVWIQKIPDVVFEEDKTRDLPLASFRARVRDLDSPESDWRFWVEGGSHIKAVIDTVWDLLRLSAERDWHGTETLTMFVSDGADGVASQSFRVTVRPTPDPPGPFEIIEPKHLRFDNWPEFIVFRWHRPTDPDGEVVNTFVWRLLPIEVPSPAQTIEVTVRDTVLLYFPNPKFLPDGIWRWTVTAKDRNGLTSNCVMPGYLIKNRSTGVAQGEGLPSECRLEPNHPNPFNPGTTIGYTLSEAGWVTLSVFDVRGREVVRLDEGWKEPGRYSLRWDGQDAGGNPVPSGIYVYRLITEKKVLEGKMMRVR